MGKRFEFMDQLAKIRGSRTPTGTGAALTVAATALIAWLIVQEVLLYFSVSWFSELVLDHSRSQRMEISLDMTFPDLPCSLLSVDTMDVAGEIQENVDEQLTKVDLGPDGQPLDQAVLENQRSVRDAAIAARRQDPNYKGPCYGARPDDQSCDTCDDVRRAYADKNWQFHDGSGFAQCVEEHYSEFMQANKDNGCRVSGTLTVSKVVGNLHFAPGESVFVNGRHSHDLSAYYLSSMPFTFSHKFNTFSFGAGAQSLVDDPLQGFEARTDKKSFVYRYFAKVVPTDFDYNNGTIVHSNQYSVTRHERELNGGRDADHPNTFHGVGGIPGIWLNYDISPMKVIQQERRGSTFLTLVMNLCSIVGAVVTTAAVVDRSVYEVNRALQARKER